jgi:hypothetical protein
VRRLFAVALTGLAMMLSACSPTGAARSDGTATPDATRSPLTADATRSPLTAAEIMMRSADALPTTSFHVVSSSTIGGVTEGDVDLARNLADLKSTLSGSVLGATRRIGNDAYIQLFGPPWLHFDVSRLRTESPTISQPRFRSITRILLGVTEAAQTSRLHFEGKVDLTKVMAAASGRDRTDLQAMLTLIDPTTVISFTATLDDRNRLTSFEYTLPTDEPTKYVYSFTDYGKTVTVAQPPAAEVKEATEAQYAQY